MPNAGIRSAGSVLAAAVAVLASGIALAPAERADAALRICGSVDLFGKTLEVRERGRVLPCVRVSKITRGPCDDGRVWSCFSFRAPGPPLVWFREKERFTRRPTTLIFTGRYPCAEALVTAEAWAAARSAKGAAFPSHAQLLADDLMRCEQLVGQTGEAARALLGEPDIESSSKGRTYLDYVIGLERGSFFQLDPEYLSVVVNAAGTVREVEMWTG